MRVRYGKPIKVRSLLGKANIPFSYTAANVTFYPLNTGTFHSYAGPNVLNIKYVNREANHKYFLFLNTDIVYSWSYFGIWDTYNTGYEGNRTAPIKDGNNYYALISPTTSATNAVPSFQFGVTQNLPAIANYALIIDLTEIGLDNLTAQEFYNKYHQYFPLIATGEEITIDDKAGQVSLYSGLPSGYQRVEYIYQEKQSDSGTTNLAFIQSNLSFADLDAVEFDLAISAEGGLHNNIVLCAYNTSFYIIVDKTSHKANGFSSSTWSPNSTSLFDDELRHKIKVSGLVSSETTKIRTAWDWSWWHKTKWYGLKLYKNNIIIQNLIPCYRKSDNVIGMYDLIGNEFYTNKGTGTFLKGPNVSNTISCKVAGGSSDIYYGYNQLIRSGDFSDMSEWTSYNCNIETVEDGYIKLITTAENGRILQYPNHGGYTLRTDHLYLIHLDVKDIDGKFSMSGFEYLELSIGTNYFIKHGNGKTLINIYGGYDRVGTYITMKNLFVIDLTEWYGAGKEPTTVQEFYSMFTKSFYGECISPIKLTRYQIEALPNYGYNQMINRVNASSDAGFTWAWDNNILTFVSSGPTKTYFNPFYAQYVVLSHKYFISANILSNSNNTPFQFGTLNSNIRISNITKGLYENIMECNHEINSSIGFATFSTGSNVGSISGYYMLIDLTDWYGEGKEPTTVEEFKQTFPNKYYPYSKKRLLNKYMINKLEN